MRVLVTGAAGYIGSILIPEMLKRGWQVDGLDTYVRGDAVLAHVCADVNFNPVRGDCRDETIMKPLIAKADVIIPLAALVGAPLCARDPLNATTINLDAIEGLFKPKAPPLVGADISSSAVKMVEIAEAGKGMYRVERYAVEPLPKDSVVDGNINNLDAVSDALKRCHKRLGGNIKSLAMALPNAAVISKKIQVPAGQREDDEFGHGGSPSAGGTARWP